MGCLNSGGHCTVLYSSVQCTDYTQSLMKRAEELQKSQSLYLGNLHIMQVIPYPAPRKKRTLYDFKYLLAARVDGSL